MSAPVSTTTVPAWQNGRGKWRLQRTTANSNYMCGSVQLSGGAVRCSFGPGEKTQYSLPKSPQARPCHSALGTDGGKGEKRGGGEGEGQGGSAVGWRGRRSGCASHRAPSAMLGIAECWWHWDAKNRAGGGIRHDSCFLMIASLSLRNPTFFCPPPLPQHQGSTISHHRAPGSHSTGRIKHWGSSGGERG